MRLKGNLRKMRAELGSCVEYTLPIGDELLPINDLIGSRLSIEFKGQINCVTCGRLTKKSFSQGHCYPCFQNHPECSPCIIHPEKCLAHEGKGRDPEWEIEHHDQPHTVYLAYTSDIKVGVTRSDNLINRWIDQGALAGIPFAETKNRYETGLIEVEMKNHVKDKTNWRTMLKETIVDPDILMAKKKELINLASTKTRAQISDNNEITTLTYPGQAPEGTIKSISLDKTPDFSGVLIGIKGQYLLFEEGNVYNVRKHQGYLVKIKTP